MRTGFVWCVQRRVSRGKSSNGLDSEKKGVTSVTSATNASSLAERTLIVSTNSNTFAVVGLSTPGPKSTSVGLRSLDESDDIRYWAWISNALVAGVVAGMRVTFDTVSFGKVATTYVDKAGFVKELKFPKRQVFWGGNATFDAPDAEVLPEQGEVIITDEARKFANNLLAKKAREQVTPSEGDDLPF